MHSRYSSKINFNMTAKILGMCWPSKTVSSIENPFKKIIRILDQNHLVTWSLVPRKKRDNYQFIWGMTATFLEDLTV